MQIQKNFLSGCVLSLFVFSVAGASTPSQVSESTWEQISDDDGIIVHRKEVPGSDVVAFKGQTLINAPIGKVAEVLFDTSRKGEWVDRLVEAKNIRTMNKGERIEYNQTAAPWPVSNRDFVFNAKVEIDRERNQVRVVLKSVVDPSTPEREGIVRGELSHSAYTLTSMDNGKKTAVVVEIHADPKGSVPKWLVNMIQKSWPRHTLKGIRAQAVKNDVRENPEVKALFSPTLVIDPVVSCLSCGGSRG